MVGVNYSKHKGKLRSAGVEGIQTHKTIGNQA